MILACVSTEIRAIEFENGKVSFPDFGFGLRGRSIPLAALLFSEASQVDRAIGLEFHQRIATILGAEPSTMATSVQ